jgi:hypothetical protein
MRESEKRGMESAGMTAGQDKDMKMRREKPD